MSPMRGLSRLNRPVNLLGHTFPLVAVLLTSVTLAASILSAISGRSGVRLLDWVVFSPRLVFAGQLWRLVTWPFVDGDALSLFVACVVLMWCGRDLAYAWGPPRLVLYYVGLAAAAAGVTCLVGLAWPAVFETFMFSPWPALDGLIVTWALLFPHRPILFLLVLRVAGMQIVYATLGLVVLMALLHGPAGYVLHLASIGLAWMYVRGESPRTLWLRLRYRLLSTQRARARGHLRPVERPADRWRH